MLHEKENVAAEAVAGLLGGYAELKNARGASQIPSQAT
jgi:hypothetical protein